MKQQTDLGLLILRLTFGGVMMLSHGWGKLMSYGEMSGSFPDPLGVGPSLSMALAVFAEFFCALLVTLGVVTRLAVIPPFITMAVAALIIHSADPWGKKELAVLYALGFVAIYFLGAGKHQLGSKLPLPKKLKKWN